MLYSLANLRGYALMTDSGEVASIADFVFHEDEWVVRYIIAELKDIGQQVLISPRSVDRIHEGDQAAWINLPVERLLQSPAIEPSLPISRQLEKDVHDFFEWPYYWEDEKAIPPTSEGDLTAVPLAEMEADLERQQSEMAAGGQGGLTRLHRFSRAAGFELRDRNDERAGSVKDFIVDDGKWSIFFAVVQISGRDVLVSPSLIPHIEWEGDYGLVDLDQETVASSPDFELETLRREAGI